jgi:uncharacterized protein YqjF (DUF2071 family)
LATKLRATANSIHALTQIKQDKANLNINGFYFNAHVLVGCKQICFYALEPNLQKSTFYSLFGINMVWKLDEYWHRARQTRKNFARLKPMSDYRPYPAPSETPVMFQRWHDLLFMHWPVPVEVLRSQIPPELMIDSFEGHAWLAVVPFRMSNIYPRGLFPVPWLSAFAELNVRTYVVKDGKPGVWFFSLDAANPVAVSIARNWFKLPYFNAQMQCLGQGKTIAYSSQRTHKNAPGCEFIADYCPMTDAQIPQPGTLEYFLTARYSLYTADKAGNIYRGEIDHEPWPLQLAEADVKVNTMTAPIDVKLVGEPLLHFSKVIAVKVWGLERL